MTAQEQPPDWPALLAARLAPADLPAAPPPSAVRLPDSPADGDRSVELRVDTVVSIDDGGISAGTGGGIGGGTGDRERAAATLRAGRFVLAPDGTVTFDAPGLPAGVYPLRGTWSSSASLLQFTASGGTAAGAVPGDRGAALRVVVDGAAACAPSGSLMSILDGLPGRGGDARGLLRAQALPPLEDVIVMAQTAQDVRTIGLIGAGNIGSTLARLLVATGRDVVLSNSRGPQTLQGLVTELGPRARAATAAEAAAAGDLVVVTVPLKAYADVPVEPLAGKVVVDTNNYYPERDGRFEALDDESTTTSGLLQAHLPGSHVVKAFNNIFYLHLAGQGAPAGTSGRRALPIAGDDATAKQVVGALIEELGFDVEDAGPLAEGWRFQRDTPAYVVHADTGELPDRLARAKRYRDITPEDAEQTAKEQRAAITG